MITRPEFNELDSSWMKHKKKNGLDTHGRSTKIAHAAGASATEPRCQWMEDGTMTDFDDSVWQRKGATLSDKTARKEYGLTQEEIIEAIQAGQLQYRRNAIHGNPFLRLVRQEIETLVKKSHGRNYLRDQQERTELASINRELKNLKKQIAALEARKSELLADISPTLRNEANGRRNRKKATSKNKTPKGKPPAKKASKKTRR